MLSLRRLIIISRPIAYIPSLAVFVIGFSASKLELSSSTYLVALFCTLPLNIVIFGINDIADRESDAKNPRKGGIDGAILKKGEIKQLTYAILAVILFFSFIFLLMGLTGALIASLILYVLAYIYSFSPFRLKSRPVLDSFSNGLWIACVFLLGYWANTDSSSLAIPPMQYLLPIILTASAYHAVTCVLDYDVDITVNDRTTAVALGKNKTLLIASLMFFVSFIIIGHKYPSIGLWLLSSAILTLSGIKYSSHKALHRICLVIIALFPIAIAAKFI